MTSANAARAVSRHPRRARLAPLPAFTVGRHTAEAARAAGFGDVHPRTATGPTWSRCCARALPARGAPLLYLAGEDRAGELVCGCGACRVLTVVVYRARKAGALSAGGRSGLAQGELDGVLHFSRRTAEAYLECAEQRRHPRSRAGSSCISAFAARWRSRSCGRRRRGPGRRRARRRRRCSIWSDR